MKVGDYIIYTDKNSNRTEFGRIKSVVNEDFIFAVYSCAGEWDNFKDYTGQHTPVENIRLANQDEINKFLSEEKIKWKLK